MKKLYNLTGMLILGALTFSSCSKKNYTASFAPSQHKAQVKHVETPAPEASVTETSETAVAEESTVASAETGYVAPQPTYAAPVQKDVEMTMEKPSFTKKERRQLKRQARKIIWQSAKKRVFSKERSDVNASDNQVVALIVSIFIPPLGVYIYQRDITLDFWVSLLLWILGIVPGIIFSWLVILDVLTLA